MEYHPMGQTKNYLVPNIFHGTVSKIERPFCEWGLSKQNKTKQKQDKNSVPTSQLPLLKT